MPLTFNGNTPAAVTYNGNPVSEVTYNGVTVWSAAAPAPTEFYIAPDTSAGLEQKFSFTQSSANAITIDWGDGSQTESPSILSGTVTHNYAAYDSYVITVACASGETWTLASQITSTDFLYSNLSKIVFGDGCVGTADYAMMGASVLQTVEFASSSFQTFGNNSFEGCTNLGSITIPDNIASIPGYCFRSCSILDDVIIGSGVASLGAYAFNGCSNLFSLTIKATTPPTVGSRALYNVPNDCDIYVPSSAVATYQAASGWSSRAAYIQAIP